MIGLKKKKTFFATDEVSMITRTYWCITTSESGSNSAKVASAIVSTKAFHSAKPRAL